MAVAVASVGAYLTAQASSFPSVPVDSIAPAAPASVASNDLVLIVVTVESATCATPSGFTSQFGITSGSVNHYLFWKRSTGSEPSTYTLTTTGADRATAQTFRITGAETSGSPFRSASSTATSTASTASTPNVSLTSIPADDLLFWTYGSSGSRSLNSLTGYTEVGTSGNLHQHVAAKTQATTGNTGNVSGTLSGTLARHLTSLTAIKPSSPPVTSTLSATAPAATASFDAELTVPATLSATAPAATASFEAENAANSFNAVAPAATASFEGTQQYGSLSATAPAATASFETLLEVPAEFSATAPAATAAFTAGVESTATLGAVAPAATASFETEQARTPGWQEVVRSTAFLEAAAAPRRTVSAHVEMIDDNNIVVATLPALAGQVSCDSTAIQRWEANLTLGAAEYMPSEVDDLLHPLSGLRARFWWHLLLPNGLVAKIPVGTYYTSAPSARLASNGDYAITVKMIDPISKIRRNKWGPGDVIDLGGQTVSDALATVINDRAPFFSPRITPTTEVLPDIYEVGQVGRDPLEDIQAIADAAAYQVYTDREGQLVAEPRTAASNGQTVLDLSVGDDCRMESLSRTLDEAQLLNRLTVRSKSPEVDPPVYATVEDDDPASPLYIGRGFIYADVIDSDAVTTEEACRNLATVELADRRALIESVDLVHTVRPEINPGELIEVTEPKTGATGVYQISSWAIGLEPGSLMRTRVTDRRINI